MKQVSVLLEEALREAGGSLQELTNPLFSGSLGQKAPPQSQPSPIENPVEKPSEPRTLPELPSDSPSAVDELLETIQSDGSEAKLPAPAPPPTLRTLRAHEQPDLRSPKSSDGPSPKLSDTPSPRSPASDRSGKTAARIVAAVGALAALAFTGLMLWRSSSERRPEISPTTVTSGAAKATEALDAGRVALPSSVASPAASSTREPSAATTGAAPSTTGAPAASGGPAAVTNEPGETVIAPHPTAAVTAPEPEAGPTTPAHGGHHKPQGPTKAGDLPKPTWLLKPPKVDNPY
jgi:hypothetical protein